MDGPSSPPLSKRLRVSLERPPPERDPTTGRPQILYDYAEGGAPVWKQEESSEEKLGKVVRRIWEEKGGLGSFTQNELDRSTAAANEEGRQGEDELMAGQDDDTKPEGEDAAEPVSEETTTLEKGIAPEQMKALKMEISDRLGQSLHALSNFHHILTLLLPSTHTPAASLSLPAHIPLPQSSLATSRTLPRPPAEQPPSTQLAEKQEALRATAEMFRTSGEELGKVVKRAEGEWEVALGVREKGGYAVGLREVERGFMGGDRKRDARDWIGWYGLDAAPPSFRHRHFAHLPAPDSTASASTSAKLVFPNRTRRRLQVTLHQTSVDGSVSSSSSACVSRPLLEEGADVDAGMEASKEMEEAMWEAVEEETFAEIIAEARQIVQTLPSRISSNSISLDVSPGLSMTISLIIPPEAENSPAPSQSSAYPTLLTSLLSLSLLSLHTHRSTVIAHSLQPVKDPRLVPSAITPAIGRPRVLQSVVEVVQFGSFVERVHGLLETLQSGLGSAKETGSESEAGSGLSMRVDWEGAEEGWEAVEVGGKGGVRVRAEGRKAFVGLGPDQTDPTVTLHLLPASRLFFILPRPNMTTKNAITTSTTSIMITDLAHLSDLLALEIKKALLTQLAGLASGTDDSGEVGFVDRLKGVALCQWKGGEVRFEPSVNLSAAFSPSVEVQAVVRTISGQERDEVFDDKSVGGVLAWARSIYAGARDGPAVKVEELAEM